jgi:hypothetical protein
VTRAQPNSAFNMPALFGEAASTSPSHVHGSYIYSVLPVAGNRLASITSADELLFLDRARLATVSRHHDDVPRSVSCMTGCDNAENVVVCAGGDGVVAMFDVRNDQRVSHFKIGGSLQFQFYCTHGDH